MLLFCVWGSTPASGVASGALAGGFAVESSIQFGVFGGFRAFHDPHDFSIVHEEGLALGDPHDTRNAKDFGYLGIHIGQQGEWKLAIFHKFFLPLGRIAAYADNLNSLPRKIRKNITQRAYLGSAAGCVGFRIKINQSRSLA